MAKAIAEVRNRALVMLGKLPLGQTPSAPLSTDMEQVYDQVYQDLKNRGLVTWSATDDIPEEFVDQIAAIMAGRRSEGIPQERYIRIVSASNAAIKSISRLISGKYVNPRKYTDF